jgi:hypothetical protein
VVERFEPPGPHQERPAPDRDHLWTTRAQDLVERLCLPLSERALALPGENLAHGHARAALDALVQVDEGSTSALRHETTERRFAGRHEAIQEKWAKWSLHARGAAGGVQGQRRSGRQRWG